MLLGRTVRFHPCLQREAQGRHGRARGAPSRPQDTGRSVRRYLENGSDFPTGKPLPWVLVSTLPQCTATWQSFSSTSLQYSCCGEREGRQYRLAARGRRAQLNSTPRGEGTIFVLNDGH